jgi:hypothetical protein
LLLLIFWCWTLLSAKVAFNTKKSTTTKSTTRKSWKQNGLD